MDYAFPIQGLGRVPASSDRAFATWTPAARREPTGVGLSVKPPTPLFASAKPIPCPAGYTWVNAYPPSPTSPKVPQLTASLLHWISGWATLYPSRAAADGLFYFHLGTPDGMALQYNPGFNGLSVCVNKSSFAAHLAGGTAPIVVSGGPPSMLLNPAALNALIATHGAVPVPAQPTSYTWLWVLLGLGAVGVAGYYLLD
jgi:hypothetical protein